MFSLAAALVNQSSRNLFLTGKAGTGKTTFLKYIRQNCLKQMAVVAPTGVAAINAGGVTIHSFFQLPFAPFIPGPGSSSHAFAANPGEAVGRHGLVSQLRVNAEKISVLRELELLIIDEISMVRCDTIDAIDTVLRHVRKRPFERFGGVQVLFIGDMYQLPPVIKEPEWSVLADYYASPYFFDSLVIREEPPVYIEFDKIYRQTDEQFIRVLNQVRNNRLDAEGKELLQQRVQPSFSRRDGDGYIVLTTHNGNAREINTRELERLKGSSFSYRAVIKDEFSESAFPADETLYLKEGAQVMFIKNDSDRAKRYFNGKIGAVTRLEKDKIWVQCPHEPEEIEVTPETWENIRYVVNKDNRSMESEPLGSFTQYPLRLAWAITIHKSQGLTFEKAIIDAGGAFAAGQVYVALSRCTSLDGMVLQSPIRPGSLSTDERIIHFSRYCVQPDQLQTELEQAKKSYQEKLSRTSFDFSAALQEAQELNAFLQEHSSSFNAEAISWAAGWIEKLEQVQATAEKFHHWLRGQFRLSIAAEENTLLQTKLRDGSIHFNREIQSIMTVLQQSPAETDSRLHAKEFNESIKEIAAELALKSFLIKEPTIMMDPDAWHRQKSSFVVPAFSINAYSGSQQKIQSPHPLLYQQLKKLRDSVCSKKGLAIYLVAGSKTLDEMATYLPQTPDELEQVSGFGTVKVEKYGQQFLDIIIPYCKQHGLSSTINDKEVKRSAKQPGQPKPDTKAESFRLFKEGNGVAAIAGIRHLTVQTIESHLAHYVRQGAIHIEELVSREKIVLIEPAIREHTGSSVLPLKQKLGDAVGFGDIKLVMAWSAFKEQEPETGSLQ